MGDEMNRSQDDRVALSRERMTRRESGRNLYWVAVSILLAGVLSTCGTEGFMVQPPRQTPQVVEVQILASASDLDHQGRAVIRPGDIPIQL